MAVVEEMGKKMCFQWFCLWAVIAPFSGQTYDLRPKFYEGKTWSTEESSLLEISTLTEPPLKGSFTYRFSFLVEKIHADGAVDLTLTVNSSDNESQFRQIGALDLANLVNQPIAITLKPDGRVASIVAPKELSQAGRAAFRTIEQKFLNAGFATHLPDKPVQMGESWDNREPFMLDMPTGEIDLLFNLRFTLDKMVEYKGRQCFMITFQGSFQGNIDQGRRASMEGKIAGKYMIDPEDGMLVHMESDTDLKGKIQGRNGENIVHIKNKDVVRRLVEEGVH